LGHFQLRFDFFQPLAAGIAIQVLVKDLRRGEVARRGYLFVALIALGAFTAFYNAWSLCLLIGTTLLLAGVCSPEIRRRVVALVTLDLVPPALLALLLLLPFYYIYSAPYENRDGRQWVNVQEYLPTAIDYLRVGDHWLTGRLPVNDFSGISQPVEKKLGLGLLASFSLLAGWWLSIKRLTGRNRKPLDERQAIAVSTFVASLAITVLTIRWGRFYPWSAVYTLVPGAKALLAVGRWSLTLAMPAAAALAVAVERLLDLLRPRVVLRFVAVGAVSVFLFADSFERIPVTYSGRVAERAHEQVAAKIPDSCAAFLVAPDPSAYDIGPETFDAARYLAENADVASGWKGTAWEHYEHVGRKEGRKAFRLPGATPGPVLPPDRFDAARYLAANPDVAAVWKGDPYDHYLRFGHAEGRIFDAAVAADRRAQNFHYTLTGMVVSALTAPAPSVETNS
jgi:hypothetical protein